MSFGQTATATEEGAFHITDERGANEPFHPISVCGQVMTRDLVEETPDGATVCKNCTGTKSAARPTEEVKGEPS